MAVDGFGNVERGDIIKITGRIEEFPTQRMNSTTQFRPIPGIHIDIIGSGPIPAPTRLPIDSFTLAGFPEGQ